MARNEHVEGLRQKVLRAGTRADTLLEISRVTERLWRDAKTDYETAHAIWSQAAEEQRRAEDKGPKVDEGPPHTVEQPCLCNKCAPKSRFTANLRDVPYEPDRITGHDTHEWVPPGS